MKIILTGGHLSPAVSVIQKLKADSILFLGRKYPLEGEDSLSLEYKTINAMGIPFAEIKTGRLQRKFSKHTIPSILKSPTGFYRSLKILKKFKPDVVLSFGGYVSVPVVLAASFLKIPIVIHEQTLEAGAANKFASRFAKKICISWKTSEEFFPKVKTVLTGNPIREEIIGQGKKSFNFNLKESKLPIIYLTGGSLGSHSINELVLKNLEKLLEFSVIIHQTGDSKRFDDYNKLSILKETMPKDSKDRYILKKFLTVNEVSEILSKADLIVSRAGINTVSELIYLNKKCILIPLSFSQRNEQYKNALMAKDLGLAEIVDEKGIGQQDFSSLVKLMLLNPGMSQEEKEELSKLNLVEKEAANKIIKVLRQVLNEEKS